ncbi:PIN domain-containing protein [Caulobacter segnis]|uniref:PIN domain-containing protein n=1 Tax=Caulobacter segnis TaxID=88688 RepID=UPI00285CCAF6|nr:PIN domain-containing protein [Caulobacter segnis]MDR6624471.1 hypothetical protein [Caulobacter segnis]
MAYAAFSIDSNILYKRIHDLNRGLLAELGQFKTASVPFLLSDVVRRELHRRALEQAQESHVTVMAALEEARGKRLAPIATIEALQASLVTPETSAQAAIDTLIAVTGATPLPDSLADIAEVTRRYFDVVPPFEPRKKDEFPDAIALSALEGWAKANGPVMVISGDGGWKAFGEISKHLDVVDLKKALAELQSQEQRETAVRLLTTLVEAMIGGHAPDLRAEFDLLTEGLLENLELEIEATSRFYFEEELTGITIDDWGITGVADGEEFDLTVVGVEESKTIFTLPIWAELTVSATFSLQHFDNVDREYVTMGRENLNASITIIDDLVVTLDGPLDEPDQVTVDRVELANAAPLVRFGEIELGD